MHSVLWHCWLGGRKGKRPVNNWVVGVLTRLFVCSDVQICIWFSWCHCHSLSLASVKSRLVLPFWYWLTWVVPDKGPLNGCVCVCQWPQPQRIWTTWPSYHKSCQSWCSEIMQSFANFNQLPDLLLDDRELSLATFGSHSSSVRNSFSLSVLRAPVTNNHTTIQPLQINTRSKNFAGRPHHPHTCHHMVGESILQPHFHPNVLPLGQVCSPVLLWTFAPYTVMHFNKEERYATYTHTHLMALFPGLPRWTSTR